MPNGSMRYAMPCLRKMHLEEPIFPPGVTREIYRRPYETEENLPELDTFIDSFRK